MFREYFLAEALHRLDFAPRRTVGSASGYAGARTGSPWEKSLSELPVWGMHIPHIHWGLYPVAGNSHAP